MGMIYHCKPHLSHCSADFGGYAQHLRREKTSAIKACLQNTSALISNMAQSNFQRAYFQGARAFQYFFSKKIHFFFVNIYIAKKATIKRSSSQNFLTHRENSLTVAL